MIANICVGLIIICLLVLAVRHALRKHNCNDCCSCGCGCDCCGAKDQKETETRKEK